MWPCTVTANLRWRSQSAGMVDDQYRGLLTEREREIIEWDADVSDNYRYRVVSRIRTKIENVDEDVEILAENREDLLEELREVVCRDIEWIRSTPWLYVIEIRERFCETLFQYLLGSQ